MSIEERLGDDIRAILLSEGASEALRTPPGGFAYGAKGVFLNDTNRSVTFCAGRVGRFAGNGTFDNFRRTDQYRTNDVARVNPHVDENDRILNLEDGQIYTVRYMTGSRVLCWDDADHTSTRWAENWLKIFDPTWRVGLMPTLSDEDRQLSDYWQKRIIDIAGKYARSHNLCSVVDQCLTEIFSVMVDKWSMVVDHAATTEEGVTPPVTGYTVLNPTGDRIATFTDQRDAQDFLKLKNEAEKSKFKVSVRR